MPFHVEVTALTKIASLESLAGQKSLFQHVASFYRNVRALDATAPEGPDSSEQSLDGWFGPMTAHVVTGGSCETGKPLGLNAFMTALVKHLAKPSAVPSPLPITQVTLRIEAPANELPKEVSGTSALFATLLGVPREQILTGNFGKSKHYTKADGEKGKRVEVSAWVYSKYAPNLALGLSYDR